LITGQGKRLSLHSIQLVRPNQSLIQWEREALSPGLKRPGHEVDNSPPSTVEAKNEGAIFLLPHMSAWRGAKLIKHMDNLISLFEIR
jgi:hypothetical protein